MSNANILDVLNALTVNGGEGVLKFLNGVLLIRSKTIAVRTTFPTPFRYPPIVLVAKTSTRRAASYDCEHYPGQVTNTGFTLEQLTTEQTVLYGYLAIGSWK